MPKLFIKPIHLSLLMSGDSRFRNQQRHLSKKLPAEVVPQGAFYRIPKKGRGEITF